MTTRTRHPDGYRSQGAIEQAAAEGRLDADAIETVLRSLGATPWGWWATIPGFAFLGRLVSLRVDTRSVPTDDPPPPSSPAELGLARLILGGLPGVLTQAEQQYRTYHREAPAAVELVHDPHIWLSRSGLARNGADRWQFVVGIAGEEDYGTHAEFAGLSCVGIWSGD